MFLPDDSKISPKETLTWNEFSLLALDKDMRNEDDANPTRTVEQAKEIIAITKRRALDHRYKINALISMARLLRRRKILILIWRGTHK